jgi:hypothetical protein
MMKMVLIKRRDAEQWRWMPVSKLIKIFLESVRRF